MPWKLIFKCTAVTVVVLAIGNYIGYLTTGKSLVGLDDLKSLSLPSFSTPEMPDLPDVSLPNNFSDAPAKKETAYKWIDDNGIVHYSSEPPESAVQIDPNDAKNSPYFYI